MRILIVDDAAFMRMTISRILEGKGFEIVGEAANGQEAVEKYKDLKPELVTMDITMPEMDGITAIHEIKKLDPDAKIIICSAMGQQNLVMDAIRAGACSYLVKPFQGQRLVEEIERILGAKTPC